MWKSNQSIWKPIACIIVKIILSLFLLCVSWLMCADLWGQPNESDLILLVKLVPNTFWVTSLFLSLCGLMFFAYVCINWITIICREIKYIISNFKIKRMEDKEHA